MYNLKIKTLKPEKESWTDRSSIVYHAVFQTLVDFIEKENPHKLFSTAAKAHNKKPFSCSCKKNGVKNCGCKKGYEYFVELYEIYNWWKNREKVVADRAKVLKECFKIEKIDKSKPKFCKCDDNKKFSIWNEHLVRTKEPIPDWILDIENHPHHQNDYGKTIGNAITVIETTEQKPYILFGIIDDAFDYEDTKKSIRVLELREGLWS